MREQSGDGLESARMLCLKMCTDANCLQTSQIQFAHGNGYASVTAKSAAPSRQDVQRTDNIVSKSVLYTPYIGYYTVSPASNTVQMEWVAEGLGYGLGDSVCTAEARTCEGAGDRAKKHGPRVGILES